MKRGFTLVELLAVIVLIAIIALIGAGGITKVRQNVRNDMCKSTVDMIEIAGKHYGEDFKNLLTSNCRINGNNYKCLTVTVQELIDNGYINVKETPKKDANGNDVTQVINGETVVVYEKVIKNESNDSVLNNNTVTIYIDGMIYAMLNGVNCN